jgi:hypothetical protein
MARHADRGEDRENDADRIWVTVSEAGALLFDLLWPHTSAGPTPPSWPWMDIDTMAGQHRLRPLLHHELGADTRAPETLRDSWCKAHRRSVMRELSQRAEILQIGQGFGNAGLDAVVLKGGAWIWRGWVPAGVRPMRDIDLLMHSQADARQAQSLLMAAGFTALPQGHHDDAKHLPVLRSEAGNLVELHTRLADAHHPDARQAECAWRRLAVERMQPWDKSGAAALQVFDDTDTLLHTILHAAVDHQFNNGPLLLVDISALVRQGTIDWLRLFAEARLLGIEREVDLVLSVCERRLPDLQMARPIAGCAPPFQLLDSVETMMLVDRRAPSEQAWLGQLLASAPGHRLRALKAMLRRRSDRLDDETRGTMPRGKRLAAMMAMALRHLLALSKPQTKRQFKASYRVQDWLHRDDDDAGDRHDAQASGNAFKTWRG